MTGDSFEKSLESLKRVAGLPREEGERILARTLRGRSNLLVARAAELIRLHAFTELLAPLEKAFARFMVDPVKTDKTCCAKIAIAKTLVEAEVAAEEVFLAGIRHVQPEPSWGGSEDAAAELRGLCGFGLVRMRHPEAPALLADLLADPERSARAQAARALGDLGRPDVLPLLRFKIRIGDADPDPLMECFSSYLSVAGTDGVPFVESYLGHTDEVRFECASYALAEARPDGGAELLIRSAESEPRPSRRRVLYQALALCRTAKTIDFLMDVIRQDSGRSSVEGADARAAHDALLPLAAHDPALNDRLSAIAGPPDRAE